MYLKGEIGTVQRFLWLARGEYAELEHECEQALAYMGMYPAMRPWHPVVLLLLCHALWQQKRYPELPRKHAEMRSRYAGTESSDARFAHPLMDGIVQLAQGDNKAARTHFRRAVDMQATIAMSKARCEARLFLAHAYHLDGEDEAALDVLDSLLPEYEQLNMPGLIVRLGPVFMPLIALAVEHGIHTEFAEQLLSLYDSARVVRTVVVPDTRETLTAREIEILRLIGQGVSNQDIADRLVISIWTVKSHVTHILRKLDVSSRARAAVRARELHIL
jgi:ATP/maltotriose-dependent transcriptional regulator MalT